MMERLQHSLFPLWPLCWYSITVVWLHSMYKCTLLPLQVNCVFLGIALKVVSGRKKSMTAKAISNKDNAKYIANILQVFNS